MKSQPNRKQVRCVETGKIFDSINQVAKILGVKNSRVRDAITHRNRTQTCGGYHWEVVE